MILKPTQEKNEITLHKLDAKAIFWRQVKNPLLIILLSATIISFFVGDKIDALVILGIVAVSVLLGFGNEFMAEKTVSDLLRKVSLSATIIRNGVKQEIPSRDLKVGDVVCLFRGAIVSADLQLTSVKDLQIDEAVLTGESVPVEKKITDKAFMGTVVVAGTGMGEVVAIGSSTKLGKISLDVGSARPVTQFQKGLSEFGAFLLRVIVIIAIVIFGVNALLGHQPINSLLFALSIAVGLTPELLPVIVTVSLSYGARQLAKKEMVVKQLVAIEDLGNMEVLCTDKTGTLTEGKITVADCFNAKGEKDETVLRSALICNSAVVHHKIFGDPIDTALWEYAKEYNIDPRVKPEDDRVGGIKKIEEEPFAYEHRAMFCVTEEIGKRNYIYKGAMESVLAVCQMSEKDKKILEEKFISLSNQGFRVTAVAQKPIENKQTYSFNDAKDLTFIGWITFIDTPKKTVKEAIDKLKNLDVVVKIITGDNEMVTKQVCGEVGMHCEKVLLGIELDKLSEEKLHKIVWQTDIFCRMTPEQKLRLISAFKYGGHTVGYMGDGINDAPALHEADVAISVNTAVDVAKDTATIVLLHKSLNVIADGIRGGRKIFNNTVKYILMGTSSNFGNMFSAAGASFLLPFLPMTPSQILLTNVLYDVSQISIPTDNVDPEALVKPKKWNINLIRRYMLFFGPISSLYDYATFGIMFFVFHARGSLFQTGWFIESLVTEVMVVFFIRTLRPFFQSRPSWQLLLTCVGVVFFGLLIPFSFLAPVFSFVAPPPAYFFFLLILTVTYLGIVEYSKKFLNRV